jgi:hypothetical protein
MGRRMAFATVAAVLPLLLLLTVDGGVAQANPVFPGLVTCNAASGTWSGSVTFSPPLFNGGTATHEVVTLVAKLGNTASPCLTTSTPPAGSKVIGFIKGKAKFAGAGANDCATVFSGSSNVPVVAKFLMKWLSPPGAPTHWKQPPAFSFVGALSMASITITGGKVTGSFHPDTTATAVLSAPTWPGLTGDVNTGCTSTTGLHSLNLSSSTGTW